MRASVITILTLIGLSSVANAVGERCFMDLTKAPYCVSKAAAKIFCEKAGDNLETLLTAKKCMNDMGKVLPPAQSNKLCLGVSVSSKDASENESNCETNSSGSGKHPSGIAQ